MFALQRLSELDQRIFEIVPEPLHDMEVVVLEGSLGPDFTDRLGESGPEVKDDAIGLDAPSIELLEELSSDSPAIEPRDGFNIEDSNLKRISGDLFVSTSSFGHIFINGEGAGELEFS